MLSATVLGGGIEYVLSGGIASGTIVNGGNEQVLAGGTTTGATVEGDGFLVVSFAGTERRMGRAPRRSARPHLALMQLDEQLK